MGVKNMKTSSSLIKEIRQSSSFTYLRLRDKWYKYSIPKNILENMISSNSIGKFYNSEVKGNFGEVSCDKPNARVLWRSRSDHDD